MLTVMEREEGPHGPDSADDCAKLAAQLQTVSELMPRTSRQATQASCLDDLLKKVSLLLPRILSSSGFFSEVVDYRRGMRKSLGGFPECVLSGSEAEASRWRNQYYTDLIREDILEFSRIHEIRAIRLLLELLRERVGTPLSYTSLAEDLQISPNTVKKYIDILESLLLV